MRLMENAEIAKLDVFGTKAKIMEENENETLSTKCNAIRQTDLCTATIYFLVLI